MNTNSTTIEPELTVEWSEEELDILANAEEIAARDYTAHIGGKVFDAADQPRWELDWLEFVNDDAETINVHVTDVYAEDPLDALKQRFGDGAERIINALHNWHPELNPSRFRFPDAIEDTPEGTKSPTAG